VGERTDGEFDDDGEDQGVRGRERLLTGRLRRSSNRAPNFDYRSVGAYFVTVVTYNRECIFGAIKDGRLIPSLAGKTVAEEWARTPAKRSNFQIDEFVVMPNHLHGILIVTTELPRAPEQLTEAGPRLRSPSNSVGAVVRGFKAATTTALNRMAGTPGMPLWQANYHDRILASDREIQSAREYIRRNPANWPDDPHFNAGSTDPRAAL
jgi:REP element-mobilizing transposase RayT